MRKSTVYLLAALLGASFFPASVCAQQIAVNTGKLPISDDQKLMLAAANKVMNKDYKGAEALYTKVIEINGGNTEAYLQRGIVRRELHNTAGMASDARTAVSLADAALQQNPHNPTLYYQRGTGLRLLQRFDQAKSDMKTAIRLSGSALWQTDLQAIELEQKMAQ